MQEVVLESAFLNHAITRDGLALTMELVILELAFHNLSIFAGDPAETSKLAALEVSLKDGSIDLGNLSRSMHHVLMEESLTNCSAGANDLGLSVQVVVLELSFGALTLVNVPTVTIYAVKTIGSHLQLSFVEELLFLLAVVVDDANSTNFALLFEVFAVLHFDKLLNATDAELALELERVAHG